MEIEQTGLGRFEAKGRLINPVVKGQSEVANRFVYRGEFAIEFAPVTEREKRPPTIKAQQVIAAGDVGSSTLSFFAGDLWSFEYLMPLAEALGNAVTSAGKYFAFCNNIELDEAYRIRIGEATWHVLPLEESSVYIELLELLDIERGDLKKRSAEGKVDAIVDGMKKWSAKYEQISFERGLEVMGPVKDPAENRPV